MRIAVPGNAASPLARGAVRIFWWRCAGADVKDAGNIDRIRPTAVRPSAFDSPVRGMSRGLTREQSAA